MSSENIKAWLKSQKKPPTFDQAIAKFPKEQAIVKHHFGLIFPKQLKAYQAEKEKKDSTSEEAFDQVTKYVYRNQDASIDQVQKEFPKISVDVINQVYQKIDSKRSKVEIGKVVKQMIIDNPDIDYKAVLKRFPNYNWNTFRSKQKRVLEELIKEGKLKSNEELEQDQVIEEENYIEKDLPDDDENLVGLMDLVDEEFEDEENEDFEDEDLLAEFETDNDGEIVEPEVEEMTAAEQKEMDQETNKPEPKKRTKKPVKQESGNIEQLVNAITQLTDLVKLLSKSENVKIPEININISIKI